MKLIRPGLLVLALLLFSGSLQAGSRESAFQARDMLGPEVWSRVLLLRKEDPGRGGPYPAEFHGLIVAFEGILWLYTEFEGTQSLSRYAGQLAQDQADPGPLLRAAEPALTLVADVTDRPPEARPAGAPPFACFLGAVAEWQRLQREPVPPTRARLLAYYPPRMRQGHMVLEYWRAGRRYVFDPDHPRDVRELSRRLAEDPLRVAQALFPRGDRYRPERALPLPLTIPGELSVEDVTAGRTLAASGGMTGDASVREVRPVPEASAGRAKSG